MTLILALLAAAFSAAAPRPTPELLGTITLGNRAATYPIDVPSCAVFGHRLARIKIVDVWGDAQLGRLRLMYADRQQQTVPVQRSLRSGEQSPWLDLGVHGFRDSRCVSTLRLDARSLPPRPYASIQVWGISETTPAHQ